MSLYRGVPSFQGSGSAPASALERELKSLGCAQPRLAPQISLRSFNTRVQEYGKWLSGFEWSIFGCVTYKRKPSTRSAVENFRRYLRELETSIDSRLAYVAVPEHRISGCGLPPIALHWHFLMACPPHKEYALFKNCRALWARNGVSDIQWYQREQSAAFYIAKTAKDVDFEFLFDNLNRLSNTGSSDLASEMAADPYVPEHAKWRTELETLTLRDREGQ